MNIIIIGGKGFIGSHIANTLKNNHNITIIDGWTTLYPGFTSIHRGNRGLQPVSELEKKHRIGAYNYRQSLIHQIECIKKWTFNNISMSIVCLAEIDGIFIEGLKEEEIRNTHVCPTFQLTAFASVGGSGAESEPGIGTLTSGL